MRTGALLLAVALALPTGCGDDDNSAGPPIPSSTVTSPPRSTGTLVNESIEIAPGRKLYLYCTGPTPAEGGKGTVLLEAGGGSGSEDWPAGIFQTLGQDSRVCAYDRAGTGSSGPAPDKKRGLTDVVADLDLLLDAAGIDGRLLLVGTSFGGQVALSWALQHPERTAGLVILDTDWPTTDESKTVHNLIPAEQRAAEIAGDKWDAPENTEHFDHENAAAETEAAFRTLPGIPIRIVSALHSYGCDRTEGSCRQLQERTVELQKQWLQLSPTAQQRVVDAGHDLPNLATAIVLEEIQAALNEADFDQ